MTDTYAGRIFWKELRAQRAFWISLLALAIGLQILVVAVVQSRQHVNKTDLSTVVFSIAMVLACSFGVGSVAIAFAGEIEARTKGLLQRIPVRPRDLLMGKLSLSVVGAYLLLLLLWLSGVLLLKAAFLPPASSLDPTVTPFGPITGNWQYPLGPLLFVAVGSLFSLVLGDVLITTVVTALATVLLFAVPVIHNHFAAQGLVIALVLIGDQFLVRRWLREGVMAGRLVRFPTVIWQGRTVAGRTVLQEHARSAVAWRRGTSSLFWKEWRQAFPFCLALTAIGLAVLVLTLLSRQWNWQSTTDILLFGESQGLLKISRQWNWQSTTDMARYLLIVIVAPLAPGIAAARADRKGHAFRLLAHRGISPDGFWVSKHLVWLSLTLLGCAVLLAADTIFLPGFMGRPRESLWTFAESSAVDAFGRAPSDAVHTAFLAGFHVFLLYSMGYLLALLLPGALMAFFSAAILWILIAFCWVFLAYLRVPFWWSVGPLPFLFLAASWVRTGDWLVGRNTLHAWAKVVATLALPLAGMFAAMVAYRITEIPAVAIPNEALLSQAAPPGAVPAKRSLFVDAIRAVSGNPPRRLDTRRDAEDPWELVTPEQKAWLKANAHARDLALEAVKRPPGVFPPIEPSSLRKGHLDDMWASGWRLEQLLLYSAREYQAENRLDDALACYVALARLADDFEQHEEVLYVSGARLVALEAMKQWAAHPKQTAERVKRAIQEFQNFANRSPLPSVTLQRSWKASRRLLREQIWGGSPVDEANRTVAEQWWMRWLAPWELWRMERLVDFSYADHLEELQSVERELHDSGFVAVNAERINRWQSRENNLDRYEQTTLQPTFRGMGLGGESVSNYVNQVAIERMNLIALAAADFKRQHHKLPDSLAVLAPVYFVQLPVDPWIGRDFLYEPKGIPLTLHFDNGTLDKGLPFLASAGMFDSRFVHGPKDRVEVLSRFAPPDASRMVGRPASFPGPMLRLP